MFKEIKTFTGKFIDPINPHPDLIDINDIAHALSNMPRFGGHTKKFYSVAEHCLRCLQIVRGQNIELETLMHDAAEAYIMDMPSPVKWRLPDYKKMELKLSNTIDIAFGLYSVMFHDRIKAVDEFVLQEELFYLMDSSVKNFFVDEEATDWYNTNRTQFQVKQMFLEEFTILLNKKYPLT